MAVTKRHLMTTLLTAGALLLSACGQPVGAPRPAPAESAGAAPGSAPAQGPTAVPLQSLRAGYTALAASHAPLWIGVEAGIFRELGLDVEPMLIGGSDKAIAALLSGEVPVSSLAANTVIGAVNQGADLVYIAGNASKLVFQLMAVPGVTSAEQLRGQPVGATGRGSATEFALRFSLRRLGLDPDTDVVLRTIAGGEAQMLAAMQAGAIQAGAFNPPNDYFAEQGGMHSLARMAEWDVPYQLSGVVVRQAYLAEQRDLLRRYVRGWVASVERMRDDPAYAQEVMRQYLQSDDSRALEWGYRMAMEAQPFPPYASLAGLSTVIEGLAATDPEVRRVQPAALLDNTLLDEAMAARGEVRR